MDVVILRKLTAKSIIGFGQYKGVSVQQMIDLKRTIQLRSMYFNLSKITFIDEILDFIRIPEKYRIKKPGKNREFYHIVNEILYGNMYGPYLMKFEKRKAIRKRCVEKRIYLRKVSKATMQRRNHGHY